MSPRVKYLATKERRALRQGLAREAPELQELYGNDPEAHVERLSQGDPTSTNRYTQAIIRWHGRQLLPIEDLYKVFDDLTAFDLLRHRLPKENRDILRLESPDDLYRIVSGAPAPSAVLLGIDHPPEIVAETEFLLDDPAGLVVSPLTHAAARYWGKNTRWCTTVADSQTFDYYNARGPLYILLAPDGAAVQWQPATYQVRDRADRGLAVPIVLDKYLVLAKSKRVLMSLWLCDIGTYIRQISAAVGDEYTARYGESGIGTQPYYTFLRTRLLELFNMPDELAVAKIMLESPESLAAAEALMSFTYRSFAESERPPLPESEYIRDRVQQLLEGVSGQAWLGGTLSVLYATKGSAQTRELSLTAVAQDPEALALIQQQTQEICLVAVRCDGLVLAHVHQQTDEICLAAVQQNGLALEYVENATPEILKAAVTQNYAAMRFIDQPTAEIWNASGLRHATVSNKKAGRSPPFRRKVDKTLLVALQATVMLGIRHAALAMVGLRLRVAVSRRRVRGGRG